METKRQEIKLFEDESRKIVLDDESIFHIIVELPENGEDYFILTDSEALYFAKKGEGSVLVELEDEGEIDILTDFLFELNQHYIFLDKDGKSDLLARLIGYNKED
ncbi:hypothetical protein [Metamycoplasma equirhinis]|uniref:DUF1292 domain-containing protein n=1 Tax=Metamycoplasma equirhinis TaxID=92402 RepID=A0ABZ0PB73_9BACT|nr:hypothetical protein [Metamycoplasma equirhinis]TPD97743.1 hypothetical protein FJM08_03025 [Metamycoplasma equirhinis]WPB54193.1 hypothetical protein R9B83_01320 [Metamycoplasma equirhinis]BDX52637.1 hypothetical protein JPM7_2440 [Metamycoplasma equirhinis]